MSLERRRNAQLLLETPSAQGEAIIQEGGLYTFLLGLLLTAALRGSRSEDLMESACRLGSLLTNGLLLNDLFSILQNTLRMLSQIKPKLAQIRAAHVGKHPQGVLQNAQPAPEEKKIKGFQKKMEEHARATQRSLPFVKLAWWFATARTLAGLARV